MKVTAEIVRRAKAGDSNAWGEMYSATYPVAFGVAMQLIKNKDTVEDILQDSYISAFTKLDTLDDENKFQNWFNRIVANNCKNYLVKKKPELFSEKAKVNDEGEIIEFDIEDDRAEYQPDNAVMTDEIKSLFYEMLNKLPEEQKACVLMCWVQELTVAETAEILGVNENTVKSRLHYAKKKLTGEAEELKKKGVTVFSVGGFALIPFLRWLFAKGSGVVARPQAATGVIEMCKAAANPVATAINATQTATNIGVGVANGAQAANIGTGVVNAAQTVVGQGAKKGIKHLGLKIGAGIVSAAIVATGTVAAIGTKNTVKAEDYLPNEVYCEGLDGLGSYNKKQSIIDIEKLEKDLCGNKIDDYYEYCEENYDSIEDYIDVDADVPENGKLSNGDEIEFTVTFDYEEINKMDGVKNKLKGEEEYIIICKVKGLEEVQKFNLFDTIDFIGIEKEDGENKRVDEYQLIVKFKDDAHEMTVGNCKITWDDVVYYWGSSSHNRIRYRVEYYDENNNPQSEFFYVDFYAPQNSDAYAYDKISAIIDIPADKYLEQGLVFAETETDIEVNSVYTLLRSANISDESFNILKGYAERQAETDFSGSLEYSSAFVAYDADSFPSYLVFVFQDKETGNYYGYDYANLRMDQHGNILNAEFQKPALWSSIFEGSEFATIEKMKENMLSLTDNIEDVEK